MTNATALSDAVDELVKRIDASFGLYLDATTGFKALREELEKGVALAPATNKKTFFYGKGNPNDSNNVIWHTAPMEEVIARNAVGASNDFLLSQYLIVSLFHLWENEYRARIAAALGVEPRSIQLGIFGDLRLLRNEILKHRGLLTESTAKKLEVVTDLTPNGPIGLSGARLYTIIHSIKSDLDRIVLDNTGTDPLHRTIWHVT